MEDVRSSRALADLNGDGRLDLILGQTRDADPTHINEASLVVFNDGHGRFPLANRVLLPQPAFADGVTGVVGLATLDLDGDGRTDLLLTHHRSALEGATGRYLQALLNRGDSRFVDDSAVRFGDQSATTLRDSLIYRQPLRNRVERIFLLDVDRNGAPDLVLNSYSPIGREAPLVHLNEGNGVFIVPDANVFTNGDLFFGENSVPIDLNGDSRIDFVSTDALAGPDRTYGTADDTTQLIALIARASVSGSRAQRGSRLGQFTTSVSVADPVSAS